MAVCPYVPEKPQKSGTLPNCDRASISDKNHRPKLPVPAAMDTTSSLDDGEGVSSSLLSPLPQSKICDATIKSSMKNSNSTRGEKRVRWDKIHTREFDLVVGDHPMCQDGLPVSLGWKYDDNSCRTKQINQIIQKKREDRENTLSSRKFEEIQISERRQSYVFPRRLSYEERTERLICISDLTLDQIKNDQIDLVVRTWNESLDNKDDGKFDNDIIMTPDQLDHDIDPMFEDDLMELEDIHIDNEIDFIDEDLGDITNFEWIDCETNGTSNFDPSTIT